MPLPGLVGLVLHGPDGAPWTSFSVKLSLSLPCPAESADKSSTSGGNRRLVHFVRSLGTGMWDSRKNEKSRAAACGVYRHTLDGRPTRFVSSIELDRRIIGLYSSSVK